MTSQLCCEHKGPGCVCLCVPRSAPTDPSPAVGTRCFALSQHALGGCERCRTHTDASASDCHTQVLEGQRGGNRSYTTILHETRGMLGKTREVRRSTVKETSFVVTNKHHQMSAARCATCVRDAGTSSTTMPYLNPLFTTNTQASIDFIAMQVSGSFLTCDVYLIHLEP